MHCRAVLMALTAQGYYVNLLKAISLKLNEATVQFFFQEASPAVPAAVPAVPAAAAGGGAGAGGGEASGAPPSPGKGGAAAGGGRPASFPLYTESIKFVNHRCAAGLVAAGLGGSGGACMQLAVHAGCVMVRWTPHHHPVRTYLPRAPHLAPQLTPSPPVAPVPPPLTPL